MSRTNWRTEASAMRWPDMASRARASCDLGYPTCASSGPSVKLFADEDCTMPLAERTPVAHVSRSIERR